MLTRWAVGLRNFNQFGQRGASPGGFGPVQVAPPLRVQGPSN
ncbi:hypothetical protein [Deinococcus radiophilus]